MKALLTMLLLLTACAGRVAPDAFAVKIKAPRTWLLEKGPMPITVFYNHAPADPVTVEWYVCFALVNGGSCNEDNLRFRQTRILGRTSTAILTFSFQDWVYATGQSDGVEARDFWNRQDQGQRQDQPLSAQDPDSMIGSTTVELWIRAEDDTLLLLKRHTLVLDCNSCMARR